jgi:hypothetical protein
VTAPDRDDPAYDEWLDAQEAARDAWLDPAYDEWLDAQEAARDAWLDWQEAEFTFAIDSAPPSEVE